MALQPPLYCEEPPSTSSTAYDFLSQLLGWWCFFVLFLFSEIQLYYLVQAGIEFVILLPQSLKCWDYVTEHA